MGHVEEFLGLMDAVLHTHPIRSLPFFGAFFVLRLGNLYVTGSHQEYLDPLFRC